MEDERKIAIEAAIDTNLHQVGNDTAVDFGQPFFAALVQITQRILVEAQLVQDRRMNVTEVNRLLHSSQADFVRGAVDLAWPKAATSHNHGESEIVVVAAFAAL